MGARSTKTYVLLNNARDAGLCFEHPRWWDMSSLLAQYPERKLSLPDDQDAWLLSWAHLLSWDKQNHAWREAVPLRTEGPDASQDERDHVLRGLQLAEWVIIDPKLMWIIPKEANEACHIFDGPAWVRHTFTPDHLALLNQRRIDENNPLWVDYVHLLTSEEAQAMNESSLELWKVYCREVYNRSLTRSERAEAGRFKRALQKAAWVILYDYEWESGLA